MILEEAFFGEGNRLKWAEIQAGTLSKDTRERLGPFLEDLGRGARELVLPRVTEDGRVLWYVLTSSSRAKRMVRDELRAMLGATYSDLDGRPGDLDPQDLFDAGLIEAGASNVFRFEAPARLLGVCRERLLLWRRLRDERPARTTRSLRSTGRVLRDFEYALQAEDGEAALACLSELKASGRLDAVNLLFLEVRRLAALRQWGAIRALPEFDSIVAMNRPRRVTEALITALYEAHLVDSERSGDSKGALDAFRAKVFQPYGRLFTSREGLSGFEVAASFLMAGVVADPPRRAIIDEVLAELGQAEGRRGFLATIATALPVSTESVVIEPLEAARALFATEDADGAMQAALSAPASLERTGLLLRCARDIGSLSSAKAAIEAVMALAPGDLERLQERAVLKQIYTDLSEKVAPAEAGDRLAKSDQTAIPTSWLEWLRALSQPAKWVGAVAVAERGAREWSNEALIADPEAVEDAATLLLAERQAWARDALRDGIPFILESLLGDEPDSRMKPLYDSLFLLLALDEQVSVPQAVAIVRVVEARLQLGTGAAEYCEAVETLADAIERIDSPALIQVALEAVDMIIRAPCPAADARQAFALRMTAQLQRWFRRVEQFQWKVMNQLLSELELPGVPVPSSGTAEEAEPGDVGWEVLAGKLVALYSLTETALRRAESVLRELAPGVRVEAFRDKYGGSPGLKAAAIAADLFVIATESAKHAATNFIEARRPAEALTAYARGKGSASMLQAVRESLSAMAAS